jgi:hypothetical protein
MRGRCPYCGARRGSSGKHATETNNMKGKVIIAALIALVLIVAVVVLLVSNGKDGGDPAATPPGGSSLPGDSDVDTVTSPPLPSDEPEPSDAPTATPPPAVTEVQVRYNGYLITDNDLTEYVGNTLALTCTTVPAETDEIPVWESSDEAVFQIVPDVTGRKANLAVVGTGDRKLTVTVGGKSTEVIVRCKKK